MDELTTSVLTYMQPGKTPPRHYLAQVGASAAGEAGVVGMRERGRALPGARRHMFMRADWPLRGLCCCWHVLALLRLCGCFQA